MKFIVDQQLPRRLVIVTKDEDFSQLGLKDGLPQAVWVRLGNCSNNHLLARFDAEWGRIAAELESGSPLLELR